MLNLACTVPQTVVSCAHGLDRTPGSIPIVPKPLESLKQAKALCGSPLVG